MDTPSPLLHPLLVSFLEGFGNAYNMLALVVLEQLQCCTSADAAALVRSGTMTSLNSQAPTYS